MRTCARADATLRELFERIVFNIYIGNTDDHAGNHAAFWYGRAEELSLTPAYDICPQLRSAGEASQVMAIRPGRGGKLSNLLNCLAAASIYHLSAKEARAVIDAQLHVIRTQWDAACEEARLTAADRRRMWGTMSSTRTASRATTPSTTETPASGSRTSRGGAQPPGVHLATPAP